MYCVLNKLRTTTQSGHALSSSLFYAARIGLLNTKGASVIFVTKTSDRRDKGHNMMYSKYILSLSLFVICVYGCECLAGVR